MLFLVYVFFPENPFGELLLKSAAQMPKFYAVLFHQRIYIWYYILCVDMTNISENLKIEGHFLRVFLFIYNFVCNPKLCNFDLHKISFKYLARCILKRPLHIRLLMELRWGKRRKKYFFFCWKEWSTWPVHSHSWSWSLFSQVSSVHTSIRTSVHRHHFSNQAKQSKSSLSVGLWIGRVDHWRLLCGKSCFAFFRIRRIESNIFTSLEKSFSGDQTKMKLNVKFVFSLTINFM